MTNSAAVRTLQYGWGRITRLSRRHATAKAVHVANRPAHATADRDQYRVSQPKVAKNTGWASAEARKISVAHHVGSQ